MADWRRKIALSIVTHRECRVDNIAKEVHADSMPDNAQSVPSTFTNKILRSLPTASIERLHLSWVSLPSNREIEFPGQTIDHLFFLEAGVASMTTTFEDGSQVEVGLFGYESILGVSAFMGTRRSLNRVYMQISGHGFSAPMPAAREEFARGEIFNALALRSVQAQLSQVAQSAGCNAKHGIDQRLARWLLLCADRSRSDIIHISQEFLATMLGVRRMSAVTAIRSLKEAGLIDHQRGEVHILDAVGLGRIACECYRVVKQHLDNVAEFNDGCI